MSENGRIDIDIKATADTGNATRQAEQDINRVSEAARTGTEKLGESASVSKRRLGDLAREVVNGDFSRIPATLLKATAESGALMQAVIGVGLVFGGLAATVGVVGKAYYDGSIELDKMNEALARTANYSGQTSGSLRMVARDMADSSSLTIGAAKDVTVALADSGRIGVAAFSSVAAVAGEFGQVMRVESDKLAPALIKLFDGPTKGARELNDTLHFLTATQLDQIRALEDMGEKGKAQALLAELLDTRFKEINQTLNTHVGVLDWAKKSWSDFWDTATGIGRDDKSAIDERLKYLEWKASSIRGIFSGLSTDEKTELDQLRGQQKTAKDKADAEAAAGERKDRDIKAMGLAQSNSKAFKASGIDNSISLLSAWKPETGDQLRWRREAIAKLNEDKASLFKTQPTEVDRFLTRARADVRGEDMGVSGETVKNLDLLSQSWGKGVKSAEEYQRIADSILAKDSRRKEAERLTVAGNEAVASVARLGDEWHRQEEAADRAMQIMPAAARKLADELAKADKEAAAERDKISKARAKGQLSEDDAKRATDDLTASLEAHKAAIWAASEAQDQLNASWEYGTKSALQGYLDEVRNGAAQSNRLVTGVLKGQEDMFVRWASTGKAQASDLFTFIKAEMYRTLYRQQFSPYVTAGTSWLSNIVSGFFNGGNVGAGQVVANTSDTYSLPIEMSSVQVSGGRASGGSVSAGSLYEVSENGPELLQSGGRTYLMMGAQGGNVVPNQKAAATGSYGSAPVVQVFDQRTAASAAPVETQTETGADGMQRVKLFIRDEMRSQVNSGGMDAAFKANYGLGRTLVKR